jgi:capsular exopolysaccharide synthesis family protein
VEGLLNTGTYQDRLAELAELPDSVDISASTVASSQLIELSATSPDEAQAIAAATAASRAFVEDIQSRAEANLDARLEPLRDRLAQVAGEIPSVEAQLADRSSLTAAQVTELQGRLDVLQTERDSLRTQLGDSISVAASPNLVGIQNEPEVAVENSPAVLSNAILGLLGGLVLGAAIALVLGALQLRVTSPSVVRSKLGLPTLASISGVDAKQRQEDLQALAGGMALMASGVSSVAVTSPSIGEGKTLVASNLARYRAALGDRVILIDANFRAEAMNGRPREGLGLAQLLAAGDDMHVPDALVDSGVANLKILPAGIAEEDPYTLITGDRVSRVLEHAAPFADLLVIDTAALLSAAESQVICSMADRTILVLDSASTQTTAAVEARDVLERVHARVLGVVLTRVVKRGASLRRPPQGGGSGGNGRRPEQSAARETTRR